MQDLLVLREHTVNDSELVCSVLLEEKPKRDLAIVARDVQKKLVIPLVVSG